MTCSRERATLPACRSIHRLKARSYNSAPSCRDTQSEFGQLGIEALGARVTPLLVPGLAGVTNLALGGFHSCALLDDGGVRCWGSGQDGQMGNGRLLPSRRPIPVPLDLAATDIACGRAHCCVILVDKTMRCWGDNRLGQLGAPGLELGIVPRAVRPGGGASGMALANVRAMALGSATTIAIRAESLDEPGRLFGWGANDGDQLDPGLGNIIDVPVEIFTGFAVDQIVLGSGHLCARLSSGAVRCAGANEAGQLGTGVAGERVPFPAGEVADVHGAVEITAGAIPVRS